MADHFADPVRYPEHYTVYPVQPIEITRHLGFCLGNAVKCVLRAPWKNGVEDCDKALQYLEWEWETPQKIIGRAIETVDATCNSLVQWIEAQGGDMLWSDIAKQQRDFLTCLPCYISIWHRDDRVPVIRSMEMSVRDLSRILALRDTTGQIYEGMTGRPQKQEAE